MKIGHNLLGNNGVKVIGEALENSKTIRKLNLTNNNITEVGVKFLAKNLATLTILKMGTKIHNLTEL